MLFFFSKRSTANELRFSEWSSDVCASDLPADTSPIVVGGTLGLTGIYSGPSAAYKITYEHWADDVNKAGGIMGRQVELILYDDESTPSVAQQLYPDRKSVG